MSKNLPERSRLAYYMELSQIGLEMAALIGIGAGIDLYFDWSPWGVISGTVFGFTGSMWHLMKLVNRPEPAEDSEEPES